MSRVRLLAAFASAGRESWQPGDIFECPPEEAARLIERGLAETMSTTPPENAMRQRARPRRAPATKE